MTTLPRTDSPGHAATPPAAGGALAALRSAAAETLAVLLAALRLLGRHWPTLLVLFLVGQILRELALRAAVAVSNVNASLGFAVMALAPLSTMIALILMLHALRHSLPRLSAAPGAPGEGLGSVGTLSRISSLLVPFLAVYASFGYLRDDAIAYVGRVLEDETWANADVFTDPGAVDVGARLPFSWGISLVVLVGSAIVLRQILRRLQGGRSAPPLGALAAYVEVLWMTLVAGLLGNSWQDVKDWVASRRVVAALDGISERILHAAGVFEPPLRFIEGQLGSILGSLDALIVLPLAWLAVGAVLYGHSLPEPEWSPTRRYVVVDRARGAWVSVPAPARKAAVELTADVRGRFGPLLRGLRLIALAGLRPMLLFCLAFVITRAVAAWLWELERVLIGPHPAIPDWQWMQEPLDLFNQTVSTVLLVCLLGAAIDHVVARRPMPVGEVREVPAGREGSSGQEGSVTGNRA